MRRAWPISAFGADLHVVQKPPGEAFGAATTSLHDVQSITDFVNKGYFRHYMLYKFVLPKRPNLISRWWIAIPRCRLLSHLSRTPPLKRRPWSKGPSDVCVIGC
mmetsp:Transcript_26446/g.62870  ORF Transcript_26446/g.62870 Transcript_26446/m.62870 type:complete len:104 (-) Transcript_26446:96-407(-)